MMNFGKFLLQSGALTQAQLKEATQSQVVFGGRLGTNLVELGYLGLDELERLLSEHLGIPRAPGKALKRPSPEALKAVSAELAERHEILPIALEKRTLHLAMLDPADPRRVDDVAFATGLRVQPYVLSELRLSALLEHHYGIHRDIRYINLGPDAARGEHAPGREAPEAKRKREAPAGNASRGREDLGMDPLADDQELIDEATFSSLHDRSRYLTRTDLESPAPLESAAPTEGVALQREAVAAADPVEAGAAVGVAALEAQLAAAPDRDTVARLTLRIARLHARAAALFVVRGGMVSGFLGDGEGAEENLDGVLVPADACTLFAGPAATGTPWRGRPPVDGIDSRVLGALSRRDVREALVIPIAVRDRVINLLYADNGGEPFGETSAAALASLCGAVARCYERLILEQKRRFT